MYKINAVRQLTDTIFEMEVFAPRVAKRCQPGEFVIVRIDEQGERIPLTICDYNRQKGLITIVFQTVGQSTYRMAGLTEADSFMDVTGPLGNPSEFVHEAMDSIKQQHFLFIAGGVGCAPVYPQVKWLYEHGVSVDVILGARSENLIILRDEMEKVCSHLYIMTDDGTCGEKGLVTDKLDELVQKQGKVYDRCVAIGPMIMMKFACIHTKALNIPTTVSMNPIMVDGTGMCGACRVTVGGNVKFACVDGPEFDGHQVDFDQAMKRQQMYKTEEGRKMLKLAEGSSHHGGCGQCGGDR